MNAVMVLQLKTFLYPMESENFQLLNEKLANIGFWTFSCLKQWDVLIMFETAEGQTDEVTES